MVVKEYQHALALLREASDLMDSVGDTLIAAHIATPLGMLEERLSSGVSVTPQERALRN